jgi:hypothetical protein
VIEGESTVSVKQEFALANDAHPAPSTGTRWWATRLGAQPADPPGWWAITVDADDADNLRKAIAEQERLESTVGAT